MAAWHIGDEEAGHAAGIGSLTEQLLMQQDGFRLLLLHAQPADEDEHCAEDRAAWQPRF